MPKVSVLIPIYNVERYLRQCLDSVVNQTLKDIEIICINDGSTDRSLDIINEFAQKDDRIRVINKKNSGYGHSMNCGLESAQGEYIGIVESDDFAEADMFEVLYNNAKNTSADIVKSNYYDQIGDNAILFECLQSEPYEQTFSPDSRSRTIFQRPIAVWSAIYKRELLVKNEIKFQETPGASYQDVSFVFKTMCCAEKVFFIKNAFLHYRIDNPNSSVNSKQKIYCIFDEFDEMERFLSKREDLADKFRYALSPLKFRQCERHFPRIDDNSKFDFFERMFKEFQKDADSGFLNKDYWAEDKWEKLQNLINHGEELFKTEYEQLQIYRAYQGMLFSKINACNDTYIYGAGKIACKILPNLLKRQFKIKGILVSNLENNPNNVMNIPVISFKDSKINKETDLILIAVGNAIQADILYELKAAGCRNILLMTEEMRSALSYLG